MASDISVVVSVQVVVVGQIYLVPSISYIPASASSTLYFSLSVVALAS